MKLPDHKHANREVCDFVRHLDVDPDSKRPVHFFFYADEESDAYRLAGELKQLNFTILDVSLSAYDQGQGDEDTGSWLCLAEMELTTDTETMNRCASLLLDLAERYDCLYDGWETRIDL